MAPLGHDLGDGAVGRAVFDRDFAGLGQDRPAIGDDFLGEALVVLDFDAEMMDRRAGTDHLRFGIVLAVVNH